jgi:hypothetical protein
MAASDSRMLAPNGLAWGAGCEWAGVVEAGYGATSSIRERGRGCYCLHHLPMIERGSSKLARSNTAGQSGFSGRWLVALGRASCRRGLRRRS